MPAPVGMAVAVGVGGGTAVHIPGPFQMLRMYALALALKSAGAGAVTMLSGGTAKLKNALGPPAKAGVHSFVPFGVGKITGAPSSRIRKTICGRVNPALSTHVDALFTSYVMTLAPGGTAPAAATDAAFVFDVPLVGFL